MKRILLAVALVLISSNLIAQKKTMYIKSVLVDSLVYPFGLSTIDFQLCVWNESLKTPRNTNTFDNLDYFPSLIEYYRPIKVSNFDKGVWLEVVNAKSFNKLQSIVQFYPFTDEQLRDYPEYIRLQNGGNDITLNVYWK